RQQRPDPQGRQGHPVSRRDWRHAAQPAGAPAARSAGSLRAAAGRRRSLSGGFSPDLRDQPLIAPGGRERPLSPGSLLSSQRPRRGAAAATPAYRQARAVPASLGTAPRAAPVGRTEHGSAAVVRAPPLAGQYPPVEQRDSGGPGAGRRATDTHRASAPGLPARSRTGAR